MLGISDFIAHVIESVIGALKNVNIANVSLPPGLFSDASTISTKADNLNKYNIYNNHLGFTRFGGPVRLDFLNKQVGSRALRLTEVVVKEQLHT